MLIIERINEQEMVGNREALFGAGIGNSGKRREDIRWKMTKI